MIEEIQGYRRRSGSNAQQETRKLWDVLRRNISDSFYITEQRPTKNQLSRDRLALEYIWRKNHYRHYKPYTTNTRSSDSAKRREKRVREYLEELLQNKKRSQSENNTKLKLIEGDIERFFYIIRKRSGKSGRNIGISKSILIIMQRKIIVIILTILRVVRG